MANRKKKNSGSPASTLDERYRLLAQGKIGSLGDAAPPAGFALFLQAVDVFSECLDDLDSLDDRSRLAAYGISNLSAEERREFGAFVEGYLEGDFTDGQMASTWARVVKTVRFREDRLLRDVLQMAVRLPHKASPR